MARERTLLLIVAVSMLVLGAASRMAAAEVVFNVNFNDMVVGSPPDTGQTMDEPSGYFAQPSTNCLVQQSHGDMQNKHIVFSDASTASAAKVWFILPTVEAQNMVSVAWSSEAGQTARGGEMTFYGDGRGVLWMRYDPTGQIYVGHGNTQGQETSSLVSNYTPGVAKTFLIDLDLGTRLFSLAIDGVQVMSNVPTMPGNAPLQVVMFGTETNEPDPGLGVNIYAFDDLVIEVTDGTPVRQVTWGRLKWVW